MNASGGDYGNESSSVSVTVTDDDSKGLVVSATELGVAEGGNGTFTVALATQPTGLVTVSVSSGDTGAATASPASSDLHRGRLRHVADSDGDGRAGR